MSENRIGRGRKALIAVITFICFLLFGGICFAAGRLLWHQGREVDVSVDTSGEGFTESVTFTVSNILGMDILIDERDGSCAMLQYQDGGEWVDICEIRFVKEDSAALSAKYGGMYAHLAPGMELQYRLDEALLESLPSGDYRIAIPYISEDAYLRYLQERAEEIDESLFEASEEVSDASDAALSEEVPAESSAEESEEVSEESADAKSEDISDGESSEEEVQEPEMEVFYKEFQFVNRADRSDAESAKEDVSGGLHVSIAVE